MKKEGDEIPVWTTVECDSIERIGRDINASCSRLDEGRLLIDFYLSGGDKPLERSSLLLKSWGLRGFPSKFNRISGDVVVHEDDALEAIKIINRSLHCKVKEVHTHEGRQEVHIHPECNVDDGRVSSTIKMFMKSI